MKNVKPVVHCSIISALVAGFVVPGWGAVRVGNASRSYAESYNRINSMPTTVNNTTDALPVPVADEAVAQQIATTGTSDSVGMTDLEQCASIYPGGEFVWDKPTAGIYADTSPRCVSVVKMVSYQGGTTGNNVVVAQVKLAAGDSIKCNISAFPESSYTSAAGTITFPADNPPTVEDVVKVMNQEQKKGAGFKIAAGALISGVAGNLSGKSDPGKDGLLGTSKSQITNTVVSALGGAAVMTASSYSGKVAGDMIQSAGVNALAGGLLGNMGASGKDKLQIVDCSGTNDSSDRKNAKCLWGVVSAGEDLGSLTGSVEIDTAFYNPNTGAGVCKEGEDRYQYCTLNNVITTAEGQLKANGQLTDKSTEADRNTAILNFYKESSSNSMKVCIENNKLKTYDDSCENWYVKISYARKVTGSSVPALVVLTDSDAKALTDVKSKQSAMDAWRKWKTTQDKGSDGNCRVKGRSASGTTYEIKNGNDCWDINTQFEPLKVESSSSGLVDITDKSRAKETAIGAGAGGAMGAFSAYQNAQTEINDRWVAASMEYKDSLQKVVCMTGNRFLSQYNDEVIIPAVGETNTQ